MRDSNLMYHSLKLTVLALLTLCVTYGNAFSTNSFNPRLLDNVSEPVLERYEQRLVQAQPKAPGQTFVVTDPGDAPDDSLADGIFFPQTLRSAIQNANRFSDADVITFASNVTLIQPATALPSIFYPVTLNGQQGTSGKTIIDGSLLFGSEIGLFVSGQATVKNFEIRNFPHTGLQVNGNGNTIQGNVIHDNDGPGINCNFMTNSVIGGTSPLGQDANFVYGQTGSGGHGISMIVNTNYNTVIGNYIGTADGMVPDSNSRNGINLEGQNNDIAGNVVSGNNYDGIHMNNANYNLLEGNIVGLDHLGDGVMGNWEEGIEVSGFSIGDTLRNNIVGDNSRNGIVTNSNVVGTVIDSNKTGTDITGLSARRNGFSGIFTNGTNEIVRGNQVSGNNDGIRCSGDSTLVIGNVSGNPPGFTGLGNSRGVSIESGAKNVTVGGPNPGDANIICGNFWGIRFRGTNVDSCHIEGNFVGVEGDGITPNGNSVGMYLIWVVQNTVFKNNIISGNTSHGIEFDQAFGRYVSQCGFYGNIIGADQSGMNPIPNGGWGIWIDSARENTFGDPGLGGNLISANGLGGIYMQYSAKNEIFSNIIGLNGTANGDMGNGGPGIAIDMLSDTNYIGGISTSLTNYIGSNDSAGILLDGGSAYNEIMANWIGLGLDTIIVYPNGRGIEVRDGHHNYIGKEAASDVNLIHHNIGDGIRVVGDSNRVENNSIWENGRDPNTPAGEGHGIYVDGIGNRIGGFATKSANVIKKNGLDGIFVSGGSGNTLFNNRISQNGELGIDLAPDGVTPNDDFDVDAGANGLQNFPVVDSGFIDKPLGATTIWGHFYSDSWDTTLIEVYINDSCDASKHGEGHQPEAYFYVAADPAGYGEFEVQLNQVLDTNKIMSMTATNDDGSTSEFSRCWPSKWYKIVDAKGDPIKNRTFKFYRVENDRPDFTEHYLDSLETDSSGFVFLKQNLEPGVDTLKVMKLVDSLITPKRSVTLPIAQSVTVDNGQFDTLTFDLFYSEVDTSTVQQVKVDHTTFKSNLVVSIEFDADAAYADLIDSLFRRVCNHMYDVTDGQAVLDTVFIYDRAVNWDVCDVRIHASNVTWPSANPGGIFRGYGNHTYLPRRFFGSDTTNRNLSAVEWPYNPAAALQMRAVSHEFGHYIFGFRDEYIFVAPDTLKCASLGANFYGYMEAPYPGQGQASTEMSYDAQHYNDTLCQNTRQYTSHSSACWEYFESKGEKYRDTVFTAVYRPDERGLNGHTWFEGPNDAGVLVQIDAAAQMTVVNNVSAATSANPLYTVRRAVDSSRLSEAELFQHVAMIPPRLVNQGKTSDSGELRVLGLKNGDIVYTTAAAFTQVKANEFEWYYATQTYDGSAGTDTLNAVKVYGSYPLIGDIAISGASPTISLYRDTAFSSVPTLEAFDDSLGQSSLSFQDVSGVYSVTLSQVSESGGKALVFAPDDSANQYFFPLEYSLFQLSDSATSFEIGSYSLDAEIEFDSLATTAASAMVLSTEYPVMRHGLDPGALQGGRTHAIAEDPAGALNDIDLHIHYSNSDVQSSEAAELSLRVFKWNVGSSMWEAIGGVVDTVFDLVHAEIPGPGVYAAFTTASVGSCCIGIRGDIDNSGDPIIDIVDLTYLVTHMFKSGPPPPCPEEANVNGLPAPIDILDLTYLVDYMFKGGPEPVSCQ